MCGLLHASFRFPHMPCFYFGQLISERKILKCFCQFGLPFLKYISGKSILRYFTNTTLQYCILFQFVVLIKINFQKTFFFYFDDLATEK